MKAIALSSHSPKNRNLLRAVLAPTLGVALALTGGCKKSADAPPPGGVPSSSGDPSAPAADKPAAPAPAAPAVEVGLFKKWPAGKKIFVQSASTYDNTISNTSQQQPTKNLTVLGREYSITVLGERQGGGFELEVEILKEKFQMQMGGRPIVSFDSIADPKTDRSYPGAPAFRKLIGAKLKYLTTADGEIESVQGVQDLHTKALRTLPRQIAPFVTPMYSEAIFKKVPDLHATLPNSAVKQGGTWSYQETFGPTNVTFTGTFKGFQQDGPTKLALLEGSANLTAAPAAGAADPNAPPGGAATAPGGATTPSSGAPNDPSMVDPNNPTGANGPGPDGATTKILYDPALGIIREMTITSQFTRTQLIPQSTLTIVAKATMVQKVMLVQDAPAAAAPAPAKK